MRTRRLGALITVAVTVGALLGTGQLPAGAQTVSEQPFASYGSGTTLGANVANLGGIQVLNAQAAFGGQSVNSQGLGSPIVNELGYAVQPDLPGKNSYGRGTGLEVGVLTPNPGNPDPNQVLLAGLAQQSALPNAADADVKQIGPVALGSVAFADILRGTARAIWDPNICAIGVPLSFGQGEATGLQLLGTPTGPQGELSNPVIGATLPTDRNVSHTKAFSYLTPNGDGTFGVVSETRQQIAPVSLLGGLINVELLGEWVLRTVATGHPGTSHIDYAPVGAGPTTPVLTLGGTLIPVPISITLQQIVGPDGFVLNLPGILDLRLGAPPRPIGDNTTPQPPAPIAANGTSASGAVDVLKLSVLDILPGSVLDLRLGHMENAVVAPPGGVKCNIPVSKNATPDPVTVGNDVTIHINIPSDVNQFNLLFGCDLVNIKATSTESVTDGNVRYEIVSADHGGRIEDNVITWDNVGNYHPGDPPIVLSFVIRIPSNSGAGTLEDLANVTASLGNCTGGIAGQDLVGSALLDGSAVSGSFTLHGPAVSRGNLSATGEDTKYLILGGAMLFGAVAIMGVRRRLRSQPSSNVS